MNETGGAVMGVGIGKGENRATEAVKKACSSPLLDKIVIDGARGVLICVTGGSDMTLFEVNEATTMVYEAASPEANIIFGSVIDERLKDEVRVTIIATGFEDKQMRATDARYEQESRGQSGLKEKLESMFPERKQTTSATRKEPTKSEAAPRKDDTPPPTKAEDTPPPADVKREADVLDFNRPDNPLRGLSFAASESKKEDAPAPASTPSEAAEDDLETPAFLRRRKNLFE